MKKFIVLSFTNDVRYASVEFSSDSYKDANLYAELMSRNSEKKYHVCATEW